MTVFAHFNIACSASVDERHIVLIGFTIAIQRVGLAMGANLNGTLFGGGSFFRFRIKCDYRSITRAVQIQFVVGTKGHILIKIGCVSQNERSIIILNNSIACGQHELGCITISVLIHAGIYCFDSVSGNFTLCAISDCVFTNNQLLNFENLSSCFIRSVVFRFFIFCQRAVNTDAVDIDSGGRVGFRGIISNLKFHRICAIGQVGNRDDRNLVQVTVLALADNREPFHYFVAFTYNDIQNCVICICGTAENFKTGTLEGKVQNLRRFIFLHHISDGDGAVGGIANQNILRLAFGRSGIVPTLVFTVIGIGTVVHILIGTLEITLRVRGFVSDPRFAVGIHISQRAFTDKIILIIHNAGRRHCNGLRHFDTGKLGNTFSTRLLNSGSYGHAVSITHEPIHHVDQAGISQLELTKVACCILHIGNGASRSVGIFAAKFGNVIIGKRRVRIGAAQSDRQIVVQNIGIGCHTVGKYRYADGTIGTYHNIVGISTGGIAGIGNCVARYSCPGVDTGSLTWICNTGSIADLNRTAQCLTGLGFNLSSGQCHGAAVFQVGHYVYRIGIQITPCI